MNSESRKLELLAPAGNLESGVIALDSGADAVYCGLKKFSARDRAENFTFEDLSKLINYAHLSSKKVYVAFNTLIKESEIPEAAQTIAKIAELSADALIVQDIGIVSLVRDFFPYLPLHASTQTAIHNSASAKIAKGLGFSRIILERQLTIDEIRLISENSPVETEIFIHGALCCSLSGQCLLSSWIGAYSGNRGKCKQACRFPSFSEPGKFPLSTRDLSLADEIPLLKKIKNLAALKIEGRLRSTDYVKNVVTAYRMLLDADEKQFPEALKEAKKILNFSCGRDSSGAFKNNFASLINPMRSGTSGIKCGKVTKLSLSGFYAKLDSKLHLGDKVRVQNQNGSSASSFTIKKLFLGGNEVKSAAGGSIVFIPCERKVSLSSYLFKIGESTSTSLAKIAKLASIPTKEIDLELSISQDLIKIKASSLEWKKHYQFQNAKNQALSKEQVQEIFRETANPRFSAGKIEIFIDSLYFAPLSHLKEIRREFWTWLAENFDPMKEKKECAEISLNRFMEFYNNFKAREWTNLPSAKLAESSPKTIDRNKEFCLPFFTHEKELNSLSNKISDAYQNSHRIFRVRSLAAFYLLKKYKDIKIITSYPLQCANSLAACEFRKLGAEIVQIWVELEKPEIKKLLNKSPVKMEIFKEGFLPIFFTRGRIEGDICEIRGKKFPIRKIDSEITVLISPQKVHLPSISGCIEYINSENYGLSETDFSTFNFFREWK